MSNGGFSCERVHITGISRLNLKKYPSLIRVTLNASEGLPEKLREKIQVCFHRNATQGPCQCQEGSRESLQKGRWVSAISAYSNGFVDVKVDDKAAAYFSISVDEEFQEWPSSFLVHGVILLLNLLLPALDWMPFYISSSMALGVVLVLLLILFQVGVYLPKERYYQVGSERKAMADQIEQMTVLQETNQKKMEELQEKYEAERELSADLNKKLNSTEKNLDCTNKLLGYAREDLRQAQCTLKERDYIAEIALAHQACVLRSELENSIKENALLFSKIEVYAAREKVGVCVPKERYYQEESERKVIWHEVGESDDDRDKIVFENVVFELEQECLEVYRRKVDQANHCGAQFCLCQLVADSEAELAVICSALGEQPVHIRQSSARSLKDELKALGPQLEELRKRRSERLQQIKEITDQILHISSELGFSDYNETKLVPDGSDLSTRKLEELYKQLDSLQKEKSERLALVLHYLGVLRSICSVLGSEFEGIVGEIGTSFEGESKNLSGIALSKLASLIQRLRQIKIERMQKLQDLATTMLELWNLMDTPDEEQKPFQNVTRNIDASEEEITETGALSLATINYVVIEVLRLEQLKVSKTKELTKDCVSTDAYGINNSSSSYPNMPSL